MANGADRRLFWVTTAVIVAADVSSKLLAESLLSRHLPVAVLGDYVQLRLVYNQCAAFGLCLGEYSRWIFFGLALAALAVLGSMVRSTRLRSSLGVVDFVDVGIGPLRWPTFNVADSAITVGAIALALSLWLEGRAQERAKEARAAEP
ncbi:MAG: hypothetical protein DMD28_07790 [Gemmatimonadetes bacterium]|nr:MAG: hypothetical protein DMD28_07790 [Gemmatimonadota bacterium]